MRTNIPHTHKTQLRTRLLVHSHEHLGKKQPRSPRRYWLLAATAVAALVIFTLTSFWPMEKSSNPIVQQAAGPLTAKKVFAAAVKYIDQRKLKPGQFFYTRTIEEHTSNDKNSPNPGENCIYTRIYVEMYVNEQSIMERMTRSDKNGTLFQLSTQTPDGRNSGSKFYHNAAVANTAEERVPCPPTSADTQPVTGTVDLEAYYNSPERRVMLDINSGDPSRQKAALNTLQSIGGFSVAENQHIADYAKPVIVLSAGSGERRIIYYFDQATKAYVGLSAHERSRSIIIEQDIRGLPTNDPPEYTAPLPPQM